MEIFKSSLETAELINKRVFLRVDYNIPIDNKKIISDFKIQQSLATIDLLLQKKAKIILATHIGRPHGFEPDLSTSIVIPWFQKHGYAIDFEPDLQKAYTKSFEHQNTILLLENLRFFTPEKNPTTQFAQDLARLADVYANDAFGLIHRTDCSVYDVPKRFEPQNRYFGLLMAKELTNAQKLLHPAHPFIVIVGGNKVHEKIKLIDQLFARIDTLLLCPALVFSFLKAQNMSVGQSLVDQTSLQACKQLLLKAQQAGKQIVFPLDYQIESSHNQKLSIVESTTIPDNAIGISIGPKSIEHYSALIKNSRMCLYNGLMGNIQDLEQLHASASIFQAMTQSEYSVIAGGDSTAAADILGFKDAISYLSTGGGALIAYLGNQNQPALQLLLNK